MLILSSSYVELGRRWGHLLPAVGLAAALAVTGCHHAAPAPPAPVAVEVGIVVLAPSSVSLTRELPGRVSAFRVAEVRARVNGIVLKRCFTEGSDVKAGQRLFELDSAPYRAALASARAQRAHAEAAMVTARLQAQRESELVDSHAVSKQEYDNAVATQKATEAEVEAGKAAVEAAAINLGYTTVTSPVSGRIGRSVVTEGAYVQATQATLLAVVQQLNPVYVDVTQSSVELLRLRRELEAGALHGAGQDGARVALVLEDGSAYDQSGKLQFSDVTVDPTTGSVTLRALFPNPKGVLLPGMFARARFDQAVDPEALLVPQRAVSRDQKSQPTVMVVGAEDKVEIRTIETSQVYNGFWLVTSGLHPGDRVIVDGLQKVRSGAKVKPVTVPAMPAGSAQPSSSATPPAIASVAPPKPSALPVTTTARSVKPASPASSLARSVTSASPASSAPPAISPAAL